ncbi:hypothetical protein [uncultured Roseobacter sp.]|nr:hypothetical protein [uncultured Roseobacter sp.]
MNTPLAAQTTLTRRKTDARTDAIPTEYRRDTDMGFLVISEG